MHVAEKSFARFVYPFVFEENQSLEAIVDPLERAGWTLGAFPESDLLPHVPDYLNARAGREATAHLLVMDSLPLAQLAWRTLATAGESPLHWQCACLIGSCPLCWRGHSWRFFAAESRFSHWTLVPKAMSLPIGSISSIVSALLVGTVVRKVRE